VLFIVKLLNNKNAVTMKKITIIVLSFLLCLGSFAQINNVTDDYHPLVQEENKWNNVDVWAFPNPPISIPDFIFHPQCFMLHGDTIINDMEYKKMYFSTKKDPIFPHDWSLRNFMREDEDKKVWYKDINSSSEEILYYDFSLEIGDTVPVDLGFNEWPVVVEDITYETINNGEQRKVFWLSSETYLPLNWHKEYWIEGIGSIIVPIYPLQGNIVGGFYRLLCFYENKDLIFNDNPWGTCYKSSLGINTFDNHIKIYPNPAKDILHIDNIDDLPIHRILLMNIYGQTVKQYKENINQINVSDIPSGMYFLKVSISKEKEIIQKIIIN